MSKLKQNTLKISISTGIDWISCTFDASKLDYFLSNLLPFGLVQSSEFEYITPLHGYTRAIRLLGGRLQWGFRHEGSGCHFELSGTGCGNLGSRIWALLVFLKSLKVKFTRLDFAFDFQNTRKLMSDLRSDLNKGNFSGFHTWQEINTNKHNTQEVTFYLGSRSSNRFARVYDKGLESGQYQEAEKLIRFEFVFRAEQSEVLASLILDEVSQMQDVSGLTFNLYKFGSFSRTNKLGRAWKNSKWYQKILDAFGVLKLRDMPSLSRNTDFENYCAWLTSQVSPQLKYIAVKNNMTPGGVLDLILHNTKFSLDIFITPKVSYDVAFRRLYFDTKEVNDG